MIARENPFNTKERFKVIQPSNGVGFIEQKIYLPGDAIELKEIVVHYKKLDSTIGSKKLVINAKVNRLKPIVIYQEKRTPVIGKPIDLANLSNRTYKAYKFISFKIKGNNMQIITNEKMIRDFPIPSPETIIMDFGHSDVLVSKTIDLKDIEYFKFIKFTMHDNYFRVTVEIDNRRKYKIFKERYGYLLVVDI